MVIRLNHNTFRNILEILTRSSALCLLDKLHGIFKSLTLFSMSSSLLFRLQSFITQHENISVALGTAAVLGLTLVPFTWMKSGRRDVEFNVSHADA